MQEDRSSSVLTVQAECTMHQVLQNGEQYLADCGIDDSATDAWLLFEYVTGIRRAMFLAERRSSMEEGKQERYYELIRQRGTRIPLQHLTGEQEFMGLTFKVNEHVLIPRQDTEILVEEALKRVRPEMKILDMCTGSGCIAVSIAKLADIYKHAQMNLCMHAADISEQALAVAQQNIAALEVQVQLIHSDLFSEVTEKYDMIVSNPPYIRTSVIEELEEEVRVHDPFIALDGKEDGLFFYRRIVEASSNYIKDGGYLLFEIGHDQGEDVSCLMKEHGYTDVQIFKDLAGLDRVVTGRLSVGN